MAYYMGIDLGTTFSSVAVSRNGNVEVLALGNRSSSVPSVILVRTDGEILIGDPAEARAVSEPSRVAREFKRRLGDPTPLFLGGAPYSAETLQAMLLKHLYDRAVSRMGSEPDTVVITHPAAYSSYKLDLLRDAARQAGLKDAVFLSEPSAAAIDYAANRPVADGEILGIYDFGGGTFDAALVKRNGESFDLVGEPQGLERLGGIDFDLAILEHIRDSLREQATALESDDPATLSAVSRLRGEVRIAKELLSDDQDASITVMLPVLTTTISLTRGQFEDMVRPRLADTVGALRRAAESAGLTLEDVSRVALVGGSSRIPLVHDMLAQQLGRPVHVDTDPSAAVALGAARHAARVAGGAAAPPVAGAVAGAAAAGAAAGAFAPPGSTAPVSAASAPTQAMAATGMAPPPGAPPPGAPSTAPFAPTPSTPSDGGRKKGLLIGAGVALVAIIIGAIVLTGGDDKKQDSADATVPTDPFVDDTVPTITDPVVVPVETFPVITETPTTSLIAAITPFDPIVGRTFTWGDVDFEVTRAEVSQRSLAEFVGKNDQAAPDFDNTNVFIEVKATWTEPSATWCTFPDALLVLADDTQIPLSYNENICFPAAGTTTTGVWGATTIPADSTLDGARLVLGDPSQRQLTVPFDGSTPAANPFPAELPLPVPTLSSPLPPNYPAGSTFQFNFSNFHASLDLDVDLDASLPNGTRRSGADTVVVVVDLVMTNNTAALGCSGDALIRLNADGVRSEPIVDPTSLTSIHGCVDAGLSFGTGFLAVEVPVDATSAVIEFGPIENSVTLPIDMDAIRAAIAAYDGQS